MTLIFSCILAFISVAAMTFMYHCVAETMESTLKKLQNELKAANDKLLEIMPELNSGKAATWKIDRKTMVMTFNNDYHERMGMPRPDWDVPTFRQICNSDCLDVFNKWIGQYSKLTDAVLRRLRFHITNDGGKTYHWWELIYNLDDITSKVQYMHGIFINIDDVVDIESTIDDARNVLYEFDLKQTFFASINHDLRTPLNAIAGFANLLALQYEDLSDEDRKSFADIVETNGDMLMQLLSDFSATNCNDIDNIKFKPRNKSVRDLINMVFRTNKVICPSHLKFMLDIEDNMEDKTVFVDTKRIEQVINNFLSNSFKFTQAGFIKLGWKYIEKTNEVEMFVTDTGTGIKKENIDKLFNQYFKIHEHAHGTGLGLNICKKIVEKQNGSIGVDSVFGKGSTFYCRFKAVKSA